MTHTPGPWEIGISISNAGLLEVRSKKGTVAHVAGNDFSHNAASKIQPDECKANARLIAAAPDLLAALKRLMSVCQNIPDDPEFPVNAVVHALAEAGAAVAKAEGREP